MSIYAEGSTRIPRRQPAGQDFGRAHQALPHATGPEPGLHARRRDPLPRHPGRSQQGVSVHGQRQPCRRRIERHGGPGSRQHRSAGRKTGDGRQSGALQALCRYRRVRSGSGIGESGRRNQVLPASRTHRRWHQSGRHQSAGVFLHRRDVAQDDDCSGDARRSARHCHHFWSGAAQCYGDRE